MPSIGLHLIGWCGKRPGDPVGPSVHLLLGRRLLPGDNNRSLGYGPGIYQYFRWPTSQGWVAAFSLTVSKVMALLSVTLQWG